MRAVFYEELGAPAVLQLGEIPMQEPGPGEVRVRVVASGLNPADWKMRAGARGDPMPARRVVPHHDGAGVIEAVGPGVARVLGERVWLWSETLGPAMGTAAEFVVVPDHCAVGMPPSLTFAEGACLGIPAVTAAIAVGRLNVGSGDTVLVASGAGAVSRYAIQLLALHGVRVIATAGDRLKAEVALAAGADEVIVAPGTDLGSRVNSLTAGRRVDALLEIDLARGASRYPDVLADGARVVIYGTSHADTTVPAHWLMRHCVSLDPFLVFGVPRPERAAAIELLSECMREGQISHLIGAVLPLHEAPRAHGLGVSGGIIGKIVLAVADGFDQSRPT